MLLLLHPTPYWQSPKNLLSLTTELTSLWVVTGQLCPTGQSFEGVTKYQGEWEIVVLSFSSFWKGRLLDLLKLSRVIGVAKHLHAKSCWWMGTAKMIRSTVYTMILPAQESLLSRGQDCSVLRESRGRQVLILSLSQNWNHAGVSWRSSFCPL